MKNLNFGLIGCGLLGKTHASVVGKIDGAQFLAYADTSLQAAAEALANFGGDYATDDVTRVLSDPRLDAVYICTRHDSHAPLAIAAARAGKHILIEKPLALNLPDCLAIEEAVRANGVYLMPAFKLRYYPLVQRARAFIPCPQVVVAQMMEGRWPDDIWAQDPVMGGGNVLSQGCHATDLIRYLAGSEPKAVWAAGGALSHPGHPCVDQCVASILFENGHVASWVQGDAARAPYTSKFFIQLFGNNRGVQLHDRLKSATFTDGEKSWTETTEEEEGLERENQAFTAALRQGRAPEICARDGIQATKMALMAIEAISSGEVQRLA